VESRKHLAAEKKRCNSHNCAQAVVCTYCDLVGLPEQTALDIAGAYGTGMGNMEGTCGALVGAEILLGLKEYQGRPVLRNAREMHQAFTEMCGASLCKDLKGRDTGKVICDCADCVRHAVELAERLYERD
jgi:C_GCAxxG_C_C family probable redox protein